LFFLINFVVVLKMKHANDFALNLITQNERADMHSALIFHAVPQGFAQFRMF